MSKSTQPGLKRPLNDFVDIEMARRGVWLVKVPRYLSGKILK